MTYSLKTPQMATHTPMAVKITVLALVILSLTGIALAQTTSLRLTSYFPAPNGRYQQLTVDGDLYSNGTLTVNGNTSLGTATIGSLIVTGNFGIGSATPTQKLDVNGKIAMSGIRILSKPNTTTLVVGNGAETATGNTFVGMTAGNANTTGFNNTFVGRGAGLLNTSGQDNTAVGRNALSNNVSGSGNTIVGQSCGGITTGYSNVEVGNQAWGITTGAGNTILGTNAAHDFTTGNYNIGFGYGALYALTTGSSNIGLGWDSLWSCTSNCDGNIAINGTALFGLSVGTSNVGIGASNGLTTGSHNVFLAGGANFWNSNPGGDDNIVIGQGAGGDTGTKNGNIFIGYAAADHLGDTNNNILMGYNVSYPYAGRNDYLSIGYILTGTNIYDAANGNIGIGTTTPLAKLDVNGNIKASGFLYPSDKRLKENIVPVTGALAKVRALHGVYFNFKKDPDKRKTLGLIAQDIEPIVPEVVLTDSAGIKSVEYRNLVALLIEAIKEQQAEIEAIRGKLQ